MKKILFFLLAIIGLCGYSQDEYYRKVDWKFYPDNVVQLTDSTYLTDAIPFDYNDPASIQRVIGNYVVDYVGHRYSVIDSTSTTITVLDIYHIGQAPQTGQIARCYRSVGDGEAEYIGSIDYSPLDESSRWKLNGSDNELLWRQTLGKAENGLYKDLRTAKLGGNLIEPTTIDQDNNSFKILNNGHGSVFSETGIAYTKIDTVDFTDSTLVTKMYVKSLIKEGTSHDSLTISAGSTGYFDVNYPQIFSGQKLIDSLGVINTKIAGKEPTFTKGNLTAGSSKVAIGGTATNALIGAGASVDVNEANIVHQNISGSGTNTHAQIDTHMTNDGDLSSTNEIQDLSLSGNTLSLSGDASTVDLSVYEPAFSKNTGFNLPIGTIPGTVLEGRTFGTAAANNTWDFILNQNSSAQSANLWINGSIRNNSDLLTNGDLWIKQVGESSFIYFGETLSANINWNGSSLATNKYFSSNLGFQILGTPLLLDWLKSGSAPASGNIVVGNGSTTNPSGVSVNQAIGGNTLTSGYIPYWDGTKLTNSNATSSSEQTYFDAYSNSLYGLMVAGASGGARAIFLAGQSGVSNGFTVNYNGSAMEYKFLDGSVKIGSLAGTGTRLVSATSDGTLSNITNASGYLYNDGTGNMIWIKTVPQSLSGTTPSLNASNGVNANISISGATTLTFSNLISGTSGTIYLTNNASVYRIKIAGYTIAPASNITYDSTGILLPASSVYTHTSIGWYYNGTTVQIHKADYNTTTY